MIQIENQAEVLAALSSPVREIGAAAILKYKDKDGVEQTDYFTNADKLISFKIEKTADETKFFGYGVCQKINLKLIDIDRELDYPTGTSIEIIYNVNGTGNIQAETKFYITEVHRDENTNQLSITGYDILYKMNDITVDTLTLPEDGYTVLSLAWLVADSLNIWDIKHLNEYEESGLWLAQGANLDGTESFREVLDDIAEITQTIYFVDYYGRLSFIRPSVTDSPVFTITRDMYYKLEESTNRRLSGICSATDLGENVEALLEESGTKQFIRNNMFYDVRSDVGDLVNAAVDNIGGLTLYQFDVDWQGNFLLEMADKIGIECKDGQVRHSYLVNDTITYNGGLRQKTKWKFTDSEGESFANSSNLGEALKQTFARVDKANRNIELLASKTENNETNIADMRVTTDDITAHVNRIVEAYDSDFKKLYDWSAVIENEVSTKMSAEDVQIAIQQTIEGEDGTGGVNQVKTITGFTFNANGLQISKSDSEMSTVVNEDGMRVSNNGQVTLVANNQGVDALNLHATTYLLVGQNSRFEDCDDGARTGCFWIGN